MAAVTLIIRFLTLLMCFGLISSFSVLDKLKERNSTDSDARVVYLLHILRELKTLSDLKTEGHQQANTISDRGGGISEQKSADKIDLQKKDYAILPPSSEWCRMMGFRACRQHS